MSRLALERRAGGLRRTGRSSSAATICASERLAEARAGRRAARGRAPRRAPRRRGSTTPSWAFSASWPTNSSSRRGRSAPRARRPRARVRGLDALDVGARACGSSARRLQGVGDQGLGRVARRAVEQRVGLLRREAEADAGPSRASSARVVAARDDDRVVDGRGADLLAQLDDDPLGGALADARAPPAGARCRRRRRRPAARAAGRRRARRAPSSGPTPWTPISSRNRSRSSSVAKP